MNYLFLDTVDSTNSYAARKNTELADMTFVYTRCQTGGRGQRGNGWESKPGENLTFSLFIRHSNFPPIAQFSISECVALAIVDVLNKYGVKASVKWPNDIYVGDKKICGILIEHSVTGNSLDYSIIGAGINLNQDTFESDAPNPISIYNITGKSVDLNQFRTDIAKRLENGLYSLSHKSERERIHLLFKQNLWRGDGKVYPFVDTASGEQFYASIKDIEPMGFLCLELTDGSTRKYAFKEVAFTL
jgi:BirA family biotin operon repressor/biotin-[acetyl-CoA-carboxylase] ligase